MPYYHATFRKHLPSIYRHGLGGCVEEQNWEGCEPGVYLAAHPALCVFVMLDQYCQFGSPASVPSKHLAEIVIIVIDDARIIAERLRPDPLIDREDVRLYAGVIDVTNMPVLPMDELDLEFSHP